jgi:hypothetical protein
MTPAQNIAAMKAGLQPNQNVKTQMTIEIQMLECQTCLSLDSGLDLTFGLCHLILLGMRCLGVVLP